VGRGRGLVTVAASPKGVDQPLELFFGKQLRRRDARNLLIEFLHPCRMDFVSGGHSGERPFHIFDPLLVFFQAGLMTQRLRGRDSRRVAQLLDVLFQFGQRFSGFRGLRL
jgi:hypothetical protein